MTATEALKAGNLTAAVAAAIEQVRTNPADRGKRYLLAELFCFTGELDRADKQLEVLFQPDAPEVMALTLFRQLIRAELARREVFMAGLWHITGFDQRQHLVNQRVQLPSLGRASQGLYRRLHRWHSRAARRKLQHALDRIAGG